MVCKVVVRKCGCCGHHEIGVEREDGSYLTLQPGMKVILYDTVLKKEKERNETEFEYHSPT
jgi:hypothetical protein